MWPDAVLEVNHGNHSLHLTVSLSTNLLVKEGSSLPLHQFLTAEFLLKPVHITATKLNPTERTAAPVHSPAHMHTMVGL